MEATVSKNGWKPNKRVRERSNQGLNWDIDNENRYMKFCGRRNSWI